MGEYKNGLENGQMILSAQPEYPGNETYMKNNYKNFFKYRYNAENGVIKSATNYEINDNDITIAREGQEIYFVPMIIENDQIKGTLDYGNISIYSIGGDISGELELTIE